MIKKLILFDLDWTLIYTGGAGIKAFNKAFQTHYNVTEAMKGIVLDGKTDRAITREALTVHLKRPATDPEIEQMCAWYLEALEGAVRDSTGYIILPGIPMLLEALAKRPDVLMALGTGNLKRGAEIKLARPDLMRYFSFGGFADDSEDRPTLLQAGVNRGQQQAGKTFAPKDVIVIGDNKRDILAGQAIGATAVGVATGPMSMDELGSYNPDYLYKDLSNTDDVIATLVGAG